MMCRFYGAVHFYEVMIISTLFWCILVSAYLPIYRVLPTTLTKVGKRHRRLLALTWILCFKSDAAYNNRMYPSDWDTVSN